MMFAFFKRKGRKKARRKEISIENISEIKELFSEVRELIETKILEIKTLIKGIRINIKKSKFSLEPISKNELRGELHIVISIKKSK